MSISAAVRCGRLLAPSSLDAVKSRKYIHNSIKIPRKMAGRESLVLMYANLECCPDVLSWRARASGRRSGVGRRAGRDFNRTPKGGCEVDGCRVGDAAAGSGRRAAGGDYNVTPKDVPLQREAAQ